MLLKKSNLLILRHNYYIIFHACVYYNTVYYTILPIIIEDKKRLKIRSAGIKLQHFFFKLILIIILY